MLHRAGPPLASCVPLGKLLASSLSFVNEITNGVLLDKERQQSCIQEELCASGTP